MLAATLELNHAPPTRPLLRYSSRDALLVHLSLLHGLLLISFPSIPLIALGLWWNSNTIAHNFLHKPFFRSRALTTTFALWQTLILGVPQSLWKQRHLAHHADVPWKLRVTRRLVIEAALVLLLWTTLLIASPTFFLLTYLPAYVIGLFLCHFQGHYEHAHGTTSHYGRLYNILCFNDGYHVEHHRHPTLHWTRLPQSKYSANPRPRDMGYQPMRGATEEQRPLVAERHPHGLVAHDTNDPPATRGESRWPPLLRWIDDLPRRDSSHTWLCALERLVLRSRFLQRFMLSTHERAFRRLLSGRHPNQICIVGGGLFPRTAIVLRRLFPHANLTIIDADSAHLATARRRLDDNATLIHAWFDPALHADFDLIVLPLAFVGDRKALYANINTPLLAVHEWIWRPRGTSTVISCLLLKRLNLITR